MPGLSKYFYSVGLQLSLEEVIKTYKGVKRYDIIDRVSAQHGLTVVPETLEKHFRAEIARLFKESLQPID